jgi:phosphosulfolactate synthase
MHLKDYLGLDLYQRDRVPGKRGITSVIDLASPFAVLQGSLETHAEYIDVVKLTDCLLTAPLSETQKRIELIRGHGIGVQPNGAYLEIARLQGTDQQVLRKLRDLGYTHVEVSASTTDTSSSEEDLAFTALAIDLGFTTYGEVGKKWPEGDRTRISERVVNTEVTITEMRAFLDAGVDHVYWEGHLLKKVIGETPEEIEQNYEDAKQQLHAVTDVVGVENIVFEVTSLISPEQRRMMLQWFIREYGPDVNVGNCIAVDIPFLEQMRLGTTPVHGLGTSGDHPWIRALARTGTGQADAEWWRH